HGDRVPAGEPGTDGRRSERGDLGQPVPLHRLSEHRRGRPTRRRGHDARRAQRRGRRGTVTTRMFGQRITRTEDERLAGGDGRYLDDLAHDALQAAVVRSPHAHARVGDIDVTDALDVEGLVAIYTYEDLEGRMAEP